jgi:hypothetical protein
MRRAERRCCVAGFLLPLGPKDNIGDLLQKVLEPRHGLADVLDVAGKVLCVAGNPRGDVALAAVAVDRALDADRLAVRKPTEPAVHPAWKALSNAVSEIGR